MNTQQVEKETGVTRQNIRYYEKAGLLHPERDKGNAYRIYSEEDVEALKIIKMLRMLDMPLEDIRRVLEQEETITEAVARQRELLLARQRQLKAAVDMCDRIRKEGDEKFNVDACLNQMEEMERQGSVFARIVEDYRKVARMEEKREICFHVERKAEHPKDIIKEVEKYGEANGLDIQRIKGEKGVVFLLDGEKYEAKTVRLRKSDIRDGKKYLVLCRRCCSPEAERAEVHMEPGRMKFFQAVHMIVRNIGRQKQKSALNILVCIVSISLAAFYQANIDSCRQQRDELDQIYTIRGEVWNYNGGVNSGLKIGEQYASALRESPYISELQESVDLCGTAGEAETYVQAKGINCLAAAQLRDRDLAWEPGMNEETFLKGERQDCCIADDRFLSENGLKIGDTLCAQMFYYTETEDALGLTAEPLGTVRMEIVGSGDMAAEGALLCPLRAVRSWFEENGAVYMPSRMSFALESGKHLDAFKREMDQAGFMEVTDGSGAAGYYKGNALVIDDSAYLEALENVEKNMRFLQAFYPLALLLMMAVGYIISYLLMQNRRMEMAIMQALGTGKRRIAFQIFAEHVTVAAMGCLFGASFALVAGIGNGISVLKAAGLFLLCYSMGTWISLMITGKFSVIAALMGKERG